jgi:outer membrane protein assembly factor BamB
MTIGPRRSTKQRFAADAGRALAASLTCLALAGCSYLPSWTPSWLGGSSSKSAEPAPLVEFSPSLTPQVAWRTSVGSSRGAVLQPAVLENAIYVASASGTVVRLGPSGEVVWRTETNVAISGGVGSDGFVVAVGSSRGDVIALGADGKELWRAQVSGVVQSPPLVGRGLVIVRASDHRVSAFDATSGKRRWNYQRTTPALTLNSITPMTFAGDLVAAGFPSGRLVMLAAANGTARWDVPVAEPRGSSEVERLADVVGAPLVIGGDVCAAAFQGRVACFETSNGNLRWARDLSAGAGVGGDTRRIYAVDAKSNAVAFSSATGANAWRQEKLLNRDLTTPLALRRAVVVGDFAGYVHFLSPEDGAFLARVSLGSEITATPRAFGGGAIVQTQDGTIALLTVE